MPPGLLDGVQLDTLSPGESGRPLGGGGAGARIDEREDLRAVVAGRRRDEPEVAGVEVLELDLRQKLQLQRLAPAERLAQPDQRAGPGAAVVRCGQTANAQTGERALERIAQLHGQRARDKLAGLLGG